MGLELSKHRVVEEESGAFVEIHGLHRSGVRTLLDRLACPEMEDAVAHGAEGITLKRTTGDVFLYFPGGGRSALRQILLRKRHSLARYGLVFVIDRVEEEDLKYVDTALSCFARRIFPQDSPFLILVIKQDKGNALTVECVKEWIQFDEVLKVNKNMRVFVCSILTGEGLSEALDWLFYELSLPVNTCTEDTQEKVEPRIEVTAKPDHKSLRTMFKGAFAFVGGIFARNTKK